MTGAALLALAAGLPGAAGLLDLAAARRARAVDRRGGGEGRGAWAGDAEVADDGRGARARRLLLALGRRVGAPAAPRDLPARLAAAGARLHPADAMSIKAGAAAAGALLGLLFAAGAPGRLGLVLPLAGAAAGFLALDGWLITRTRTRARRMAIELPDTLDLLRVALEAGQSPTRALQEVGRRHRGELAAEFARAAAQASMGVPRAQALRDLTARAPCDGIPAVVAVLARADRLGAPPAEALAALARDAREARGRARAEAAAKAAPKIQLVVALLLVPSVMLLVAAALAPALVHAV